MTEQELFEISKRSGFITEPGVVSAAPYQVIHHTSKKFEYDVEYNFTVKCGRRRMSMKLIIAIVQDEDASKLLSVLMQQGFGVTKLATTGGFLKAGNTTLLLGVDDNRIDEAVSIVESVCKSRKQISTVSPSVSGGISQNEYSSYPIEVTVGGATMFVLTVDQFLKV